MKMIKHTGIIFLLCIVSITTLFQRISSAEEWYESQEPIRKDPFYTYGPAVDLLHFDLHYGIKIVIKDALTYNGYVEMPQSDFNDMWERQKHSKLTKKKILDQTDTKRLINILEKRGKSIIPTELSLASGATSLLIKNLYPLAITTLLLEGLDALDEKQQEKAKDLASKIKGQKQHTGELIQIGTLKKEGDSRFRLNQNTWYHNDQLKPSYYFRG